MAYSWSVLQRLTWSSHSTACNLLLCWTLCAWATTGTSTYVVESFHDFENLRDFNHMTVDQTSGKVYIGAVNRLYQLSETLGLEQVATTGPHDDNPNCPPPNRECSCSNFEADCDKFTKRHTDSINKALIIDYANQSLIACTNLFQGFCEKRNLRDIAISQEQVYQPVVPNDQTSPVVVFIAPGPKLNREPRGKALYVGATRSMQRTSAYIDKIYSFSSRNMSTFDLAYSDLFSKTKLDVEIQQRDVFRVHFVYGFSSYNFSYFLFVRGESVSNIDQNITAISRVCQNDTAFTSYAEVALRCRHNGTYYTVLQAAYVGYPGVDLARSLRLPDQPPITENDHVLYTVYTKQEPPSANVAPAASGSVMCVYRLRDLRGTFTKAIQACFKGTGNIGPDYITEPKACSPTKIPIDDNYCGRHKMNHPVLASEAVTEDAAIFFANVTVSSIYATTTDKYTVAFLGTQDGYLRKVVVESGTTAFEYEKVVIQAGSKVNADMAMDRAENHLYVMTERKLTQLKVQDCGRYTDCLTCVGARDPYCGWCSLESRCTVKQSCDQAEGHLRWLPYKGTHCTRIIQVMPQQVQLRKEEPSTISLTLTIQNLPSLTSGSYECAFIPQAQLDTTRYTSATATPPYPETSNSTLTCDTPSSHLLPQFPTGKDHIMMTLSLRTDNRDFVSTNITFFDCSVHNSCTSCTNSNFPCTWCVQSHQCTHNRESCGVEVLITGKNVQGRTDRPGPNSCPKIENAFTKILVPSGERFQVRVKALNLLSFQGRFKCIFHIAGDRMVDAKLKLLEDMIECDPYTFQYSESSEYINVPFQILWLPDSNDLSADKARPLDNPDNIQVQMYKCFIMAASCGECLTLDNRYRCGWCGNSCTMREACREGHWLDTSQPCPNPTITKITPISGPLEGGTNVTIEGQNLGKIFDDIEHGVMVAEEKCEPYRDQYRPATRIVCETGRRDGEKSGPVEVIVANTHKVVSTQHFHYQEPRLLEFTPSRGPRSGGTNLTITGEHLNIGTEVSVTVANNQCAILPGKERSARSIVCQVPAQDGRSMAGMVLVKLDKASLGFGPQYNFTYVEDPTIERVTPRVGILNGGTKMYVSGTNLDDIQEPRVMVYLANQAFFEVCHNVTADSMVCLSPNFSSLDSQSIPEMSGDAPMKLSFGMLLDGCEDLRNLTSHKGHKDDDWTFLLYPNPIFVKFEGIKRMYELQEDNDLTIRGQDLDLVLTKDDYVVMVGGIRCDVLTLSSDRLSCRPAEGAFQQLEEKAKVTVLVGDSLSYDVGEMTYEKASSSLDLQSLDLPVIISVSVAAFVLLIIIVAIFTAYRRKSRESDRAVKRLQNQMDVLEARVAKECKEAFAELQTELPELSSDMSGPTGIPFRDYRSFCMRVLFPHFPEDEHPVMRPFDVSEMEPQQAQSIEHGLRLFNALIANKTFLLAFIHTLEQDSNFTIKDRVNVASLISTTLQNRMEYQTDILKTLLSNLIEKSMDSRNHPRLLLRRTESVAEKMLTNWFTFLLYKFLRECAGEPLFMLFRAIKQQVDKGPVDALTSEAKYSLSEDKLIRQMIEYKQLTLRVMDYNYASQEHTVKVLDCDTISQVKGKILDAIHKNGPSSIRIDKDDLDLEWHTGVKGRIILQDEDMTSKQEGEFKRLNTLAHYGVPDNALMALVPKQASMYNLSLVSDRSHGSHQGLLHGQQGSQIQKYGGPERLHGPPQVQFHGANPAQRHGETFYSSSPSLSRSVSPHTINIDIDNGAKYYHLVKPHDSDTHREGERGSKMVSEIYLTRLLATKGTLQQFVDDLFETIFSTANRVSALPLAIKYMFDFLDDQALQYGITDPEVVHIWKSNSLPLRFWVNQVKNPDFVFDIDKSNIVDSCLSVVAQTFMDSCSMSDHKLSKDSPSSKLLYAKDIPKYKKWVERYYMDIKQMPAISDQDMNATLAEESSLHQKDFNVDASLFELYQYVTKYNDELMTVLEEDEFARNYRLPYRLEQVHGLMESNV